MQKLKPIYTFIFLCCILTSSVSLCQTTVNLSKYKIDELSKSSKFNCTAFRITIPIDLNNDGSIDFVTTGDDMGPCGTNGEISYLKFFVNNGEESYTDQTKSFSSDSLWVIRPNWYLVEDFNNDNKKDIFITGEHIHANWDKKYLAVYPFLKPNIDFDTSNNFSFLQRRHHLYLSQKDGTYKDSPEFLRGMRLGSTFGITAIDYNKDGYVDLINTIQQFSNNDKLYPSGWDIEIFLNYKGEYLNRTTPFTVRGALDHNNNTFNKSRIDSLNGCVEGPENIKFHDVNGDGFYDMIFADRSGNSLCMLSQNKYLDLYSPIIKFDDFAKNDLLTGMPGSSIGVRGFYITDIRKNGSTQLIAHWANGGGDYQAGKKLYQLIKVFDIKDKSIVDVTSSYFEGKSNIGTAYGNALLELIDMDNDGYVDLFPKCFDHDGMGNQGFNNMDSTVYFKNSNGKFKLVSLGLKYYFKEFKDMADSMKIYKYDTIHKFSIANNLIPVKTGKSNKLIFYSYATEPGIDGYYLNQYPNKYFLNTKNRVFNDSLKNYFTGFILKPDCNYLSGKFKEDTKLSMCVNQSKTISSIDTFPNIKYQWYYNNNKIDSTKNKIIATKDGQYRVLLNDENNCFKFSDTLKVTVNPLPKKPIFNTTKYSFCANDSLRLTIMDILKSDTLKWYFGTKSDLSNVPYKTFTDSSKVYVTRTDSLGCMISSDTIQITKYSIPSTPTISRDTANNLVASIDGITWFKDGIKISDTTQKIKPTSNGIYSATTTQNGCTSAIGQGYYYLTNAVSNLSIGEYFKISPNPTTGELNINYKISSFKNVNISIFDINGKPIFLNKKIESGSKINIASLANGNYLIQVRESNGKMITSQKLIKD